jgi:integrase
MASFYKRGKTWSFSIDIGFDKDGKRKKKGVGGFKLKKDAEEAAAQLLLELKAGTYVDEEDVSFRNFSKMWFDDYKLGNVKKSTIRIRNNELSILYKYFDGISIKEITRKQYQDALIDLLTQGYAESTIEGVHCTGGMIFAKAVELKAIKEDPTEYVRSPRKQQTAEELEKEEEELPKFLEKEELAKFLKTAQRAGLKDDYAIFLTLSYTGIRVGELCSLRDVSLNNNDCIIKITRTYYNPNNSIIEYELLTPKTTASRRTIKTSNKVFVELIDLLKRQNITKIKYKETWHNKGFIFCVDSHPGYPIYPKLVANRMQRLLKLSELNTNLSPHSLRHTHTSLLAEAGVSLEAIMERLGHEDDETTRKIYLHVTKAVKKEVAHKFDELMDNL